MVKTKVKGGRVKDIMLPVKGWQQILAQYVDNTSLTLLRDEDLVRQAITTLESFCLASGLLLNWNKSVAYWKEVAGIPRLAWTNLVQVTWATNSDMSKLLGAPFRVFIESKSIGEFFFQKIQKKLVY